MVKGQAPEYQAGWVYIKVKDSSSVVLDPYVGNIPALNALFALYGKDSLYHPFQTSHPLLDKIYKLHVSDSLGVGALVTSLQALGFVEYAEKIPLYRTGQSVTYTPNDWVANQWHLPKINAPGAWDIAQGTPTIKVAVIDNAFRITHEDLAPTVYTNQNEVPGNFFDDDLNGYIDDVNGWDAAHFDNNPNPPAGASDTTGWVHGTHCAGIAAAATDNGVGIASIGFGVSFVPIKACLDLTDGNAITHSDEGIDYAIRCGADVLSMSFGGKGSSLTTERLLQVAELSGITLIAAAGNSNDSSKFYPAAYAQVLAVGSTNSQDQKSGFSNFGSWVDVMAPGSSIYSTTINSDSQYGTLSGTSMACPLVAGLAGLVLSAQPGMSPQDVKAAIRNGCENIDAQNPNYLGQVGSGRINARNSLLMVSTGMAQFGDSHDLILWPTPASQYLLVRSANIQSGDGKIIIMDNFGRIMREDKVALSDGEWELDLTHLPAGYYHLGLSTPSQSLYQSFHILH